MPGEGKSISSPINRAARRNFQEAASQVKPDRSYVALTAAEARNENDKFDIDALFKDGKAKKKLGHQAHVKLDTAITDARVVRKKTVIVTSHTRKRRKEAEPVTVDRPRRFQDGLPVYKSYGGFSDIACGQTAPKDTQGGKCPFDCWCCF